MRVLLLQPPKEKEIPLGVTAAYASGARSSLPPLGLLSLASFLKSRHDVRVADLSAEDRRAVELREDLEAFHPRLVGVGSVITLWRDVLDVAREVKAFDPSIKVVIGGANATRYPSESLRHRDIDFVVCGSGQQPLMDLCDSLEGGGEGAGIPGCLTAKSAGEVPAAPVPLHPVDDYPPPDRLALPPALYRVPFAPENPATSMMSGVGCPFRCAFCDCRLLAPVSLRKPAAVVDEMSAVEEIGIRTVLFQDEVFTLRRSRVLEICRGIIARGLNLHWMVKSRVDAVDAGMLDAMREAGCFRVHFGIESGSDATLERMGKGFTVEKARESVRAVKDAGMECTGNFMLGYPGEDEEAARRTIAFAGSLDLDYRQFFLTVDTPGTDLFREAVAAGRRREDPFRLFTADPWRNTLDDLLSSDRIPRDRLLRLLEEAQGAGTARSGPGR